MFAVIDKKWFKLALALSDFLTFIYILTEWFSQNFEIEKWFFRDI